MAQGIDVDLSKDARGAAPTETDRRAMAVAIALFFMVGFLTCLNDIIIPHLKSIFEQQVQRPSRRLRYGLLCCRLCKWYG